MNENNPNEQLLDMGAPLSIVDALFNSEIDKINDDNALLNFCQAKNKSTDEKEKLDKNKKIALAAKIEENILSKGKNLSIETIFELSILLNGKIDLCSLYGIDISELDSFKFDSLNPIFDFIEKHKNKNNNADNIGNYIRLVQYFAYRESVKTCSVTDFLKVMEFDFTKQQTYKHLTKNEFLSIYGILLTCLDGNKANPEDTAKIIGDILSHAPGDIFNGRSMVLCLKLCKQKRINISIEVYEKRIIELYKKFCPESLDFHNWCMLLSCCKDHSMSQDIFESMIKNLGSQKDFISTVFFLNISSKEGSQKRQKIKTKFGKYIFTPSLINFIKQKFNFDKNYNLEQVLKDTFGKDNLIEDDDCDLGVKFYRLRFENYLLIPHKKEDVIRLFESTKSFLPEKYRSFDSGPNYGIKRKFEFDFDYIHNKTPGDEIYKEFDGFVKQIFIEKGVLPKDKGINNKMVSENQIDNNCNSKLTLEELKIIVLSNFKLGKDIKDSSITEEQFRNLIPDKINDPGYFGWLLEFYKYVYVNVDNENKISKENFLFCVKRYKFIDQKDFNDFCHDIHEFSVYDDIRFDVDCVNALLDAYDDCKYLGHTILRDNKSNFLGFDKNKDYIAGYMQDIVKNVKDQNLLNRIKQKFGIKLDICNKVNNKVDQEQQIYQLQDKNRQRLDNHINNEHDEKKTPIWLIIITLGAIFWGPWLFKKMFGCCYNFDDDNITSKENKNWKRSNRNLMPKQDEKNDLNLN